MQSLLLVALLSLGAARTSPEPLDVKQRLAAKKLYVAKCAKCHKFYDPHNYSDQEWDRWMRLMSRKSKLKPDQDRLLTRYLDELRATK